MQTTLRYIARTPNLEIEKSFSTDFPVDHVDGARRSNTKPDYRNITVRAIEHPEDWQLDVHGFCFLRASTHLDPERVYSDKNAVQNAYWRELEEIIHAQFPRYSRIECFDLTVRKRDPDFPAVSREYRVEYEQPSTVPHCDWSKDGSLTVLRWCFPGNEAFWEGKRYDMLNVWRPLKGPTDDWPLVVCDYTSIDQNNDILLTDAIRRDRVDEISILHANNAHKWYYFQNQGVDDLLVFRNCDSHGEKARAFHTSVSNPNSQGPPRESVEVRLVALY